MNILYTVAKQTIVNLRFVMPTVVIPRHPKPMNAKRLHSQQLNSMNDVRPESIPKMNASTNGMMVITVTIIVITIVRITSTKLLM